MIPSVSFTGVPSVPNPCGFRANSFTSVTLMWTPPNDTPLCVHNYTVYVFTGRPDSGDAYSTLDNATSITVTGLSHAVIYAFAVAARDGAGRRGNISQPRPFTLDGTIIRSNKKIS